MGITHQRLTAKGQHGPFAQADVYIGKVLLVLRLLGDGADLRVGIQSMPHLQGLQPGLHSFGKASIDAFLDDET
ncbi:hypothetical protein D3C72_1476690 [compost metagenome]